jgi:hypothetical protein
MAQVILRNIIRILFVLLLQALVVSRMELLDGMVLPWIYIFGILMLPFNTPPWLVLVTGGAVGLCADFFTHMTGLHMSAGLFLGFMQPRIQRLLAPREGYDPTAGPTVQHMGLAWYATYASILTLSHHLWLFYLEVFRFSDFFLTLLRVLMSTAGTVLLMTIGQYLIYTSKASDR